MDYAEFGAIEKAGWSDPATARAYAEEFALASAQCVPATVTAAGVVAGTDALDLCCGPGVITAAPLDAGARTTALDFSPAMLDMARQAAPGATFHEGDASDLPFDDDSFDAVTIGFGLPHLPDPEAVLAEAHRVLRPGGRIAFSTWHGPDKSLTFRTVFGAIAQHGHQDIALPPAPDANAFADPDVAFPALARAGFDDPALVTVDSHWICDSPDRPFDIFIEGTVRGGHLLRAQPEANNRAIRQAISEAVIADGGPEGPWRVGIPAAIVSARA